MTNNLRFPLRDQREKHRFLLEVDNTKKQLRALIYTKGLLDTNVRDLYHKVVLVMRKFCWLIMNNKNFKMLSILCGNFTIYTLTSFKRERRRTLRERTQSWESNKTQSWEANFCVISGLSWGSC